MELEDLFKAYYDCRKSKRYTKEALKFEVDLEANLLQLYKDITGGTYRVGKSSTFIVEQPVKREIFAGSFRDRVVHHYIINKINHLFEKEFIYDSYSCRVGKGTHFGIKRLDRFIRRCSVNYSEDCYILKLDIKAFFMSTNKNILYNKIYTFLRSKFDDKDSQLILNLCHEVIYNNPVENCQIVGDKRLWKGLPSDKSLFNCMANYGLPIGNLTSQIFANFYLNEFDHYIKSTLGIRYYGRYVDDFFIVHRDKSYLRGLIPVLESFLFEHLELKIHPKKIYLQHYSKGVKFLGAYIKPGRIYISNRTKGNFYNSVVSHNSIVKDNKPSCEEIMSIQCSMNSYLGLLKHYSSYNIRYNTLSKLSYWWKKRFAVTKDLTKITMLK